MKDEIQVLLELKFWNFLRYDGSTILPWPRKSWINILCKLLSRFTRWPPTPYKWRYNPFKWPKIPWVSLFFFTPLIGVPFHPIRMGSGSSLGCTSLGDLMKDMMKPHVSMRVDGS